MDFPCVLTMTFTAQEVWEAGFPFADAMLLFSTAGSIVQCSWSEFTP